MSTALPYHLIVGMPALSPTMETGTISKWNVSAGDEFSAGDSLAVIETDKATIDFEAQDDGVVGKILVEAGGGEVAVGEPIMVTVEEKGDVGAFENFTVDSSAPAAAEPSAPAVSEPAAAPTSDLPYHLVVGMPALSPTMEAGTISKWNVATGDSFGAGDSLAVIETDKASMDFGELYVLVLVHWYWYYLLLLVLCRSVCCHSLPLCVYILYPQFCMHFSPTEQRRKTMESWPNCSSNRDREKSPWEVPSWSPSKRKRTWPPLKILRSMPHRRRQRWQRQQR